MKTIADEIFNFLEQNEPINENVVFETFENDGVVRNILLAFEEAEIIEVKYPSWIGQPQITTIGDKL